MLSFPHPYQPYGTLPYHHARDDAEEELGDFPGRTLATR
jgi:hypothetical protein